MQGCASSFLKQNRPQFKKRFRNHPLILIPLSNGVLPERLLVGDNMSKAHTGNSTTFLPSEKQKRNI
jgi:hypothetical protein